MAPFLALASLATLCLHVLWAGFPRHAPLAKQPTEADSLTSTSLRDSLEIQTDSLGGKTAFTYIVLRVIASLALFITSVVSAVSGSGDGSGSSTDQWLSLRRLGESIAYVRFKIWYSLEVRLILASFIPS